jgi:hypothetical protein
MKNISSKIEIIKMQYYSIFVFWVIFFGSGHILAAQGQPSCDDGDKHLFITYQNGKVGFADKFGSFIIPPKFDNAFSYLTDGQTAASVNKLWGLIDTKGNWVIEPKYGRIIDVSKYVLIVRDDHEKFRILDKTSEAVIANFEEVRGFGEGGLAPFRRSGKWGYIDLLGNIVIDAQFDDAGSFSQGLAPARKDNKNFYINRSGQIVFELKEGLSGGVFNEGLAVVSQHVDGRRRSGFIDINGNIVIKPEFREVWNQFEGGFASYCENERCGFINTKGEKVIPPKYDYVGTFSDGLAYVKLNGKRGFVNEKGQVEIPIRFDAAGSFECGIAYVEISGKWSFIDKKGRYLFPPRAVN